MFRPGPLLDIAQTNSNHNVNVFYTIFTIIDTILGLFHQKHGNPITLIASLSNLLNSNFASISVVRCNIWSGAASERREAPGFRQINKLGNNLNIIWTPCSDHDIISEFSQFGN